MYITLTYSPPPAFGFPFSAGTEKTLASWGITSLQRDNQNMAHDSVGLNIPTAATSADVFAYGGQITINLGRTGSALGADGQPTSFSGGFKWYRGYRMRNLRNATGRMQEYQYKFAGTLEFFLEHHQFQKFIMQWNGVQGAGAGLVMQPATQIWLGQSIATLTEPNGQQTTNMTIAQQVAEIVQFTIAETIAEYSGGGGGNPIPNTISLDEGTNPDVVIANYIAGISPFNASNPEAALFAMDTMFNTDSNFNVVGLGGIVSPMNGNSVVGGWLGLCPMDAANDLTCAEALRKTLKIIPGVTMWFDFSPTIGAAATSAVPVLHIATRDYLIAIGQVVTLPWGNSNNTQPYGHRTSKIDRRDDLLPTCVDYKFKVTTTSNGTQFIAIYDDVACAAGVTGSTGTLISPGQQTIQLTGGPLILSQSDPAGYNAALATLRPQMQRFDAEVATFDFNGGSSVSTTLTTLPIPFGVIAGQKPPTLWSTVLVSAFNDPSITGLVGAPVPNVTLTLVNTETIRGNTYPAGTDVSNVYSYFIVGGPIAAGWTDTGNPGVPQGVQLTLAANFSWVENTTLSDGTTQQPTNRPNQRKTVSIYGFTAPGGTYGSITSVAEPIPFGLAAYVYNIENIVQFDGSHGIVESDHQTGLPTITDPCPIGKMLNLAIPTSDPNYANALSAGIVAQYADMNAQVQTVSYDIMSGHTDITFGVPTHLGGKELIERLRINRGPRWLYEIGPTITNANSGGNSVSGTTQLKDTQSAVTCSNYVWMPASASGDGSTIPTGYQNSGAPGSTIDTRPSGQPNYSGVAPPSPNVPVHFLAAPGAGATIQSFAFNSAAGILTLQQQVTISGQPAIQTVRLSVLDLMGSSLFAGVVRFREYACCCDFGDGAGPVPAFVILPGSVPYKTSLGSPLAGPWMT